MTSRTTRSTIPMLPPIGNPINPGSLGTDHQGHPPMTAMSLAPPEGDKGDLEARIGTLEQAHRMLLDEIANSTGMGGAGGLNHTHLTIAHILKTLTDTERQVHSIQTQLEQVMGVTQRTRDETYSYQRASWASMNDSIIELRDKVTGLQTEVEGQRKAWSGNLATMSSDLGQQIRNGAETANELEKRLKNVKLQMSDNLSKTTASLHSSLANLTQSRYDKLSGVIKEMQGRISSIEAHDHQQNTWLKQSFQDVDERLSKQSSSLLSSIKIVGNHVQKLEHQLESVETNVNKGLHSLNEQWKKDKSEIEERINKEVDKWAGLNETTLIVGKLVNEVEHFKETFKDHKSVLAKSMSSLTSSLSLIEQESEAMKHDLTQVLKAEIKIRLEEERSINDHCTDIILSYSQTTEQLKQSMAQLEENSNKNNAEVREILRASEGRLKEAHYRLLTDMDARLQASVHNKEREWDSVQERVTDIDHKLQALNDRLDSSIESEETWAKVQKINTKLSETSAKLHEFMTSVQEMQLKLGNQIQSESGKRFQEMLQLRNDLSWITSQLLSQHQTYNQVTNTRLTAPSVFVTQNQPVDNQVGVVTSPTPEPITSPQSSPPIAHKWKKSRKGRGPIARHVIEEPAETMGTFTSLAPTPVEMRKILGNEPSDYLMTTTDENQEVNNSNEDQQDQAQEEEGERGEDSRRDDENNDNSVHHETNSASSLELGI